MKRILGDMDSKDMKGLVDESKVKLGSGVVALVSTNAEGRASLYVGVTTDLTPKLSAVDLVRVGAAVLGGKGGGGRPDLAQAGGPHAGKAAEALEAISAVIAH
jgi:alanyl-tRNA synthetase